MLATVSFSKSQETSRKVEKRKEVESPTLVGVERKVERIACRPERQQQQAIVEITENHR